MCSKSRGAVSQRQVLAYAESYLGQAVAIADAGWKCTGGMVWRILLLAAARVTSIHAACQDLAATPSDDAVGNALDRWLPKRTQTLETQFLPVFGGQRLPKALRRKARVLAVDLHSVPYHGEVQRWSNELRHGKAKSGTTKSHEYATICVVHKGCRYTLAVTSVKQNETMVTVLKRLLSRVATQEIRIKTLLLDRQFFTSAVMAELQSRNVPYLMPVMLRGRKPGRRKAKLVRKRTLRDYLCEKAGRYYFTWGGTQADRKTVTFDVVVTYKSYVHEKSGKRRTKKMLFAAWRVRGAPVELRELYRKRFAIETTYRQLGQARIRTSTRSPVERLLFVLIALVLRNLWVWLHWQYFSTGPFENQEIHLARLRFRRMLKWIDHALSALLHDGTAYVT